MQDTCGGNKYHIKLPLFPRSIMWLLTSRHGLISLWITATRCITHWDSTWNWRKVMRWDSVEMKATVIMFLLAVVLVGWCSIALWSDCSSKHGDQAKVNKHAALTFNPAKHDGSLDKCYGDWDLSSHFLS